MTLPIKELEGLRVNIMDVEYRPDLDAPDDRPFPFLYRISILNGSDQTVTIKGRKWVVTDSDGSTLVVEGDGVVGKFPRLEPGQVFSYSSYHTVASDSVARGSYLGITDEGDPVLTRIPSFRLAVPR